MSKELYKKYTSGLYDNAISAFIRETNEILSLGLVFPSNASPKFYIYVVPDEDFRELLDFPCDRATLGGGKCVQSFDLDGFSSAYGVSSNVLEGYHKEESLSSHLNNLHEFAHLVHNMFFSLERFIREGFAEAFVFYTLGYEEKFDLHSDLLTTLSSKDILSAEELIVLGNETSFASKPLIENGTCQFELPYISSYLFVRGCLEHLAEIHGIDPVAATQMFLEIMNHIRHYDVACIRELAEYLELPENELLNKKTIQLEVLEKIAQRRKKL